MIVDPINGTGRF